MRNKLGVLAIAFSTFLGAQGAFADLVTNGGFETGDLTGWTVTGAATLSSNPSSLYGVDTLDAASGTYGAYLGSDLGPLTLSQILTVQAGQTYDVGFALAETGAPAPPSFTNSFSAILGGQTLFSETAAPAWPFTTYSFTYTAPANSTGSASLQFVSANDLGYFSLDSVSINAPTATPEPATCLMMVPLVGLLALAGRRISVR